LKPTLALCRHANPTSSNAHLEIVIVLAIEILRLVGSAIVMVVAIATIDTLLADAEI
jgi:hypothetical protein